MLGSTCIMSVSYPIMYVVLNLHVWVCCCSDTVMFQMLPLTALVIRGSATRDERFIINFDRVAIKKEKCVVSCSVCRISFGDRTSRRGASSQSLD